ncbi:hypothetical protein EVAR_22609_1 [Eumeta japonica]|uniref:Uncharacterized protein n=1 Tax=Eumeta variegata TaxID=151549 RepID=A0A4C1U7E5_EUMVA|nr:hypothetical protein EVAR_22609_1 [Eumeta japonica]
MEIAESQVRRCYGCNSWSHPLDDPASGIPSQLADIAHIGLLDQCYCDLAPVRLNHQFRSSKLTSLQVELDEPQRCVASVFSRQLIVGRVNMVLGIRGARR